MEPSEVKGNGEGQGTQLPVGTSLPTDQEIKEKMEQDRNDREIFLQTVAAVRTVSPSGSMLFHTQYDMVRQFHAGALGKGNCYIGDLKTHPPLDVLRIRYEILKEEFGEKGGIELLGALARGEKVITLEHLTTLLDWICDMNYFLMGLAVNCGLPYDTAFLFVQNANMRKVVRQGGPIFRADGKVLKPEGWMGPEKEIFEAIKYAFSEATIQDSHQKQQGPEPKATVVGSPG